MSDITISIVSHGHGEILELLLDDLSRLQNIDKYKIIITLNLPGEQLSQTLVKRVGAEIVRNSLPRGFGENHNSAFKMSNSEWFVVLNPDIRIQDDVFNKIARNTKSINEEAIGVITPLVKNSSGGSEDHIRSNITPWSLIRRATIGDEIIHGKKLTKKKFFWLAGMFMMFKSEAFKKVNGFDERYFLYCEDYDICARLYLHGYSVKTIEDLFVIHNAQRTSHRSWRYFRWHITSILKVWMSAPYWRIVFNKAG